MIGNGVNNVYPGQFVAPSTPVGPNGGAVNVQVNQFGDVDSPVAIDDRPDYIGLAIQNGGQLGPLNFGPESPLNPNMTPEGQPVNPHLLPNITPQRLDFG